MARPLPGSGPHLCLRPLRLGRAPEGGGRARQARLSGRPARKGHARRRLPDAGDRVSRAGEACHPRGRRDQLARKCRHRSAEGARLLQRDRGLCERREESGGRDTPAERDRDPPRQSQPARSPRQALRRARKAPRGRDRKTTSLRTEDRKTTMAVTRSSAADRRRREATGISPIPGLQPNVARDRETLLLAGGIVVFLLGLLLVYLAKTQPFGEIKPQLASGQVVAAGALREPGQLTPLLDFLAEPAERTYVAGKIFERLQEGPIQNVG